MEINTSGTQSEFCPLVNINQKKYVISEVPITLIWNQIPKHLKSKHTVISYGHLWP